MLRYLQRALVTGAAATGLLSSEPALSQQPTSPSPVNRSAIWSPQHVVDLSYALDEKFPWIPVPKVTFPFSMRSIATVDTLGVAANAWTIHEHLGTQIDAPNHFIKGGRAMSDLRQDELTAPIVVLDFKAAARANVDAEVSVADLQAWEARYGPIPQRSIVIMNSGWGARIGSEKDYINLDEKGLKRFPGFSVAAVEWLVDNRDIWGVGVDTISFDPGRDNDYKTHKALLGRDRLAIEALANLDRLPPVGATLIVGAINVRGATGGLVRPIAVWTDQAVPGATGNELIGRWQSAGPEPIPDGRGGFRYLTRTFTFAPDRWVIDFTMHADRERRQLLYSGRNEGTWSTESGSGLLPARFGFARRMLTPGTLAIATALTEARCGSAPWVAGTAQDVGISGCTAFRVPAISACAAEYDVVRIENGRAYLGARPASGDICAPERRPEAAGTAALVRIDRPN